MNERSIWGTPQKIILSILLGMVSLLAAPYGIEIMLGNIPVSIPWSLLFPIFMTMAFGWQYGLVCGLAGGAYFPFQLWPDDGWANVTTCLLYLIFFSILGLASNRRYVKNISSVPLRLIIAVVIYIVLNYLYETFLFNQMLNINPPFWIEDAVYHFPLEVLYGFLLKDSINVIAIVLACDTFLRLPIIRKTIGMEVPAAMGANSFIFITTLCIPILAWLSFIGLGAMLLSEENALRHVHKMFALLVIMANGFFVARLLFYFSEKQFFTQSKLNESEEQFRLIFENVQDVVYQMDFDGIVLTISPSVYAMIGYTREEIVGTHSTCLYETDELRAVHLNLLSLAGYLEDYEITVRTQDGLFKHVSVNSRIIKDAQGKPHHIDGVIRDLTERKKYEMQIETQNQQLQIKNKELEQFAYIASHDLQEPLLTLMSVSDSIQKEYKNKLDEKAATYIDFIRQSSLRMQELVKGLLNYARIGKSEELVEVNCQQLVQDVLQDMNAYIKASQAQITLHDLPIIEGYEVELKQLFAQLIGNAIKFSKPNVQPQIIVSAKKQINFWLFSIQDNGIGIEAKDQEKIFMIFKRLHNRNEYDGTGIGLSHCKKIVALHGGNISVHSTPGKGSTFNFTIPRL
jgi:PAS domain S-box-containing protein